MEDSESDHKKMKLYSDSPLKNEGDEVCLHEKD